MKDHKNVFARFVIQFSQAESNSAIRIHSLTEKATLVLSHLYGLAVILASSTMNIIPQGKLYGALGRALRFFQIGFWTEITPITYTDFVAFFFALLILEIAVISGFFYFVLKKKPVPSGLEMAIAYQVFIVNRYLIYIPLYQSSFYVIFNAKSETVFYALAIFNLTVMTIIKVFLYIISYRPAYSTTKFLSQYLNKELGEMIWFLIILGIQMSNHDTSSMIPTYLLFSLTCQHLIISVFHPVYALSALNRLDLFCHSFTFGFTLVIILQATAYDGSKMEFPFPLVTSFLYLFMINIDGYRKGKIFNLFHQKKARSALKMRILPFIYEEFVQVDTANWKLLEAMYPLFAHQIDTENNEKEIFSTEEYSLESVPLKHKANKAFINFISKCYEEYFKAPNVFRSGVQSIIIAYLFFVRIVLQDNLKALFLINDFRRKLKAKRLSFGWLLGIQVARLEESCTQEYFSLKFENALDTRRVFVMLKQSDELIWMMSSWTHRKIEFLEELNAPLVSLQVVKDKGIELVKDSKAILSYVRQEKDLLKFSKIKNALKIFTEEVLEDHDYLTFDLKAISNMAYHTSKLQFESLDTLKVIEKLQNNQKHPILMFATDDYAGTGGKITHNTEYLVQKLGYAQSEVNHLHWSDILVAIEETLNFAKNENSSDIRNHDACRTVVSQAILRHRNGGFVALKSTVHIDIIDDVPSIVLLGQEEPIYHQNFLLCKLDGTIEGTSNNLAETLPESIKFKGRNIQEILRLNYSPDYNLTDQHGSTPIKGKLVLSNSNVKEINFLITHLNNAIPSKDGYYLIRIYEKYILTMFKNRNPVKDNHARLFVSQMEIKTEAPPFRSLKTLNSAPGENLVTKKDEQEFRFTDVLIPPGDESFVDRVQISQDPKLRKLTSKVDSNRVNFLSGPDSNTPEKSQLVSRGWMSPMSQEPLAETQNNVISINGFTEEESNTSPSHRSEKLVDDEEEEQLERKRNLEFIKNQRAFSVSGSASGGTKQKRSLERIKRKLKDPSVPLEIRSMKLLQIAMGIGLILYLALDYVDLTERYIILSELSGLTSFPLMLLRTIYGFFQTQELIFTALKGLWSPDNNFAYLFLVPKDFTASSSSAFNAKYKEYVMLANPQTYYPDFRYDNYTVDLSLPDTPYLNRAVHFHEALTVLRGYLIKLHDVVVDGSLTHEGAFNFLRTQSSHYDEMLWTLSEDLFNRMNKQFDELVTLLQLRIMAGGAVALVVGISVLYSFVKLYKFSDLLLSKTVTISGSEILDEINRLAKKATIMHGLENGPHDKKNSWGVTKKIYLKDSQKKHSISKKYIPLRKEILPKAVFIVFLVGLYLIPAIVGYFIKADPVSHCIPLLRQYKIISVNADHAIEIPITVTEAISLAVTGHADQASYYVDQTQSRLEEVQSQSKELSDFLNNNEILEQNSYTSSNLTNALASLRNASYCDLLNSPGDLCHTSANGLPSLGVIAVKQKLLEWTFNFRSQLKNSNFDATVAAGLTFDQTLADLGFAGQMMSNALGIITDIYIKTFKEIATNANRIVLITLIVGLIYYAVLLTIFVFPAISRVEKQYREITEVYTLLPTHSLVANPYIKNVLKIIVRL